jgi:hypothetical protein
MRHRPRRGQETEDAADAATPPDIAADGAGNFVVVWRDTRADAGGSGIYARRYTAAGRPVGAVFHAIATSAGEQQEPAVAVSPNGTFLITWHVRDQATPGNGDDLYARRFSAAGAPLDVQEFRVNATTKGNQINPSIAVGADGRFVVSWQRRSGWTPRGISWQRGTASMRPGHRRSSTCSPSVFPRR